MSPRLPMAHNLSEVPPDSFGEQLRRLRTEAGLSQRELGNISGIGQQRVSTYELGKNIPDEKAMMALAAALNVPPATFFESTRFRGVLPVGAARRERMKALRESDWQLFDRVMDVASDLTPEQRSQFDRRFQEFLARWHES